MCFSANSPCCRTAPVLAPPRLRQTALSCTSLVWEESIPNGVEAGLPRRFDQAIDRCDPDRQLTRSIEGIGHLLSVSSHVSSRGSSLISGRPPGHLRDEVLQLSHWKSKISCVDSNDPRLLGRHCTAHSRNNIALTSLASPSNLLLAAVSHGPPKGLQVTSRSYDYIGFIPRVGLSHTKSRRCNIRPIFDVSGFAS